MKRKKNTIQAMRITVFRSIEGKTWWNWIRSELVGEEFRI